MREKDGRVSHRRALPTSRKVGSLSGKAVEIEVKSRAERNMETQIERKTSQNFKSFGGEVETFASSCCCSIDVARGIVEVGDDRERSCFSCEVAERVREGVEGCDIYQVSFEGGAVSRVSSELGVKDREEERRGGTIRWVLSEASMKQDHGSIILRSKRIVECPIAEGEMGL